MAIALRNNLVHRFLDRFDETCQLRMCCVSLLSELHCQFLLLNIDIFWSDNTLFVGLDKSVLIKAMLIFKYSR